MARTKAPPPPAPAANGPAPAAQGPPPPPDLPPPAAPPVAVEPVDPGMVAAALAAPFDPAEVKFKPQTVSGGRALAVPYVDARVIQDRLDDVLGVMNWQDGYQKVDGGCVVCRLSIRLGSEWITKEDVGGPSEQPDEGDRAKSAYSDALKRAAVKFGIGRYLYRMKPQWVDYDPQKRRFLGQPALAPAPQAGLKELPPRQQAAADSGVQPRALPQTGPELVERLKRHDQKLTAEGVIRSGALVAHVLGELKRAGMPSDPRHWDAQTIQAAVASARAYDTAVREGV